MRKRLKSAISVFATVTALAAAVSFVNVSAFAQDDPCSVGTLYGSFGVQTTGSIVALGPVGQVAEAGIMRFDGQGGVSQSTTLSLNGTIISRASLSGAYQVHADCTGDLAVVLPVGPGVTITSTSHFVIVDHGKEIRLVNTGAGRVIVGNARKQ